MATAIEMIDNKHLKVLSKMFDLLSLHKRGFVSNERKLSWRNYATMLQLSSTNRFPVSQLNHSHADKISEEFFGEDIYAYLTYYSEYQQARSAYANALVKLANAERELALFKYSVTSEETLLGELLGEEHECDLMVIQAEADLQDAHKKFIDNRKQMRLKYPENTPVVYCQNVPTNQSMDE